MSTITSSTSNSTINQLQADKNLRIIKTASGMWLYAAWKFSQRAGVYEEGFCYQFDSLAELQSHPDFYKPFIISRDMETIPSGYPDEVYYCGSESPNSVRGY